MAEGTEVNEENYRALQREIIKTQNKLNDLKTENSKWNKAGNYLTNLGEELDTISTKVDSLGNKLSTKLTLPIATLATAGLTYNAQLEKYTTAFATFLGDANEAEKVVEQIKNDASKTPFDVTSLVQANQMLISTGENAEASQKVILALGDAVTATGGGNDELTRMAANLQQIKNAGKATALDIKQFAYAGIDIYGILADYTGKTTAEVKDMEISYEDLAGALEKANSEGGKYYDSMNKSSETLTGQVNQLTSEFKDMTGELTKSLMPIAKKTVAKAKELIEKIDGLSDSQKENIIKIGLMVAAAGPLLKVGSTTISTIGKVSSGLGTMTKAIGVASGEMTSTETSVNSLANVFKATFSPTGLAVLGVTAAVGIIIAEIAKAEAETKAKFETMGTAATDFYKGIQTAEGYLSDFNSTLFTTTEEQENLQKEMDEIQSGITQICKTASDERRGYTQEEITQLDEYFQKLRELKNREIEIQQQIAGAITQQAVTNAETFQGSLEEYKVQSQEWIATAQKQAQATIDLIEEGTIEEVALLNQRYGEEATMQNEAYATEYNNIMTQKQAKIDAANAEVAEVTGAYTKGYADRSKSEDSFYTVLQEYSKKQEDLLDGHNEKIRKIKDDELWYVTDKAQAINSENKTFAINQENIWKEMYKNMSEEQAEELGIWLAMLTQTELYGGEISEENQEMVDTILDSYEDMPDKTKKAMENAMSPMLEEMEKSEPSLYTKATGIADGILSRLKKSFDIHSPSKETRGIFQNVMKGAELGLDDEEKNLNNQIDTIANQMKTRFSNMIPDMGAIKQSVIEQTQTVFTTPNITFNVQKMDEANLNAALNYINRRLGSQY